MRQLTYRRLGSGTPLMLVHGYLGGQFMWKFQEPLQEHFDLIMPSLAGYGESAALAAPDSIPGNVEDICALLDVLGIEKVDLLGHSMGGMIVQEMAANRPERVNRLICLGTGSMGVLPNRFEPIAESRRKIIEIGLDHAREQIARTWFVKKAWQSACPREARRQPRRLLPVLMRGKSGMAGHSYRVFLLLHSLSGLVRIDHTIGINSSCF
jgi:pimeloyl-ACP methyl ester carboxylesterase